MMKTILFDLDGTLIETTEIILDAFVETFDKFFPDVKLSKDELTNLLGQTLFKTFEFYTDSKEKVDEVEKVEKEKKAEEVIEEPKEQKK